MRRGHGTTFLQLAHIHLTHTNKHTLKERGNNEIKPIKEINMQHAQKDTITKNKQWYAQRNIHIEKGVVITIVI